MKKSTLVKYLTHGYFPTIKGESFELISEAYKFQTENENLDFQDFVKELKIKFPEFDILHDSHVRVRVNKIESHLKTIKIIIVIYFILSILIGIFQI